MPLKNRDRIEVVAKTFLVNNAGAVLVLWRSEDDAQNPGRTDIPGGKIDAGEDVFAAAVREIREEAGIDISPTNLKVVYAHTDTTDKHFLAVVRIVCTAKFNSDTFELSDEHSRAAWLSVEDALKELPPNGVWHKALHFCWQNNLLPK